MSTRLRSLLQFELGSIQQFITEGPRLREMRGASALLDDVNQKEIPRLLAQQFKGRTDVIRTSGSVTLLGVHEDAPFETEDHIRAAIRAHYHKRVPGAALYDAEIAFDEGTDIPTLLSRLSYAVALSQGNAPSWDADTALLDPLVRFCQSCGARPATTVRSIGGDTDLVCRSCEAKDRQSRLVRQGGILERFSRHVQTLSSWQAVDVFDALADDLGALSKAGRSGDVALIRADGNGLGKTLRLLSGFDQYQAFSRGIASVVERALFEALALFPPVKVVKGQEGEGDEHGGSHILPWEILYVGGDDVMVVTTADIALDVVRLMIRSIETYGTQLFAELGLSAHRKTLTMAAGVAMASPQYPFLAFYELAGQLEGKAKRKAYALDEDEDRDASTVDFHRLTASGRTSLGHIRKLELQPRRRAPGEGVSLTRRPYALETLETVLGVVRVWATAKGKARLPRSKIHYLREKLFESPAEAMFAWAHVVGRARREERDVWITLNQLSPAPEPDTPFRMPWLTPEKAPARQDGAEGTEGSIQARRDTFLLDVIDLYTIASKKPTNADADALADRS